MRFRLAFCVSFAAILLLLMTLVVSAGPQSASATNTEQSTTSTTNPASTTSATATTTAKTATTATVAPNVALLQATSSDALTLTDVGVLHLELPVTIEETAGGTAKDVNVLVAPLSNGQGSTLLTFQPANGVKLPVTLGPYQSISGSLVADLPWAGTYTSPLRLTWEGKIQKRYAISITRAATAGATAPPLDAGELPDRAVNIACGTSGTLITTTVGPNGVEPVTISRPELRSLKKKIGTATVGAASASMDVKGDNDAALTFPILLNPGQKLPLRLTIKGLEGAGSYDVKLQFGSLNHTPLEKTFSIYAREAGWVAFLWILAGVVASFILRTWFTKSRPRLLIERRFGLLDTDIAAAEAEAGEDARAVAVVADVRTQIREKWAAAVVAETWTDTAAADLLARKARLLMGWIEGRAAARNTKPPEIGLTVASDLDGIEAVLRSRTADAAAITAQEVVANGLRAKLRTAAVAEIQSRAAALVKQLDEIKTNRPVLASAVDNDVRPLLDELPQDLGKDDLSDALARIDNARKQFAVVLAKGLFSDLEKPAPDKIDAGLWAALKQRLAPALETVGRASTADLAMRRFEDALSSYLRTLVQEMSNSARKEASTATADRKEVLTKVLALLDGVEAKIGTKLFEAWHDTATAHDLFSAFDPRTASSMGAGAAAPARPQSLGTMELSREGIAVTLPAALPPPRTFADTTRALSAGDWLANVLALLIATAVGLSVLWNPSLSWGGTGDHLTALLWGLGVHQLSFTGLSSVIDKFK